KLTTAGQDITVSLAARFLQSHQEVDVLYGVKNKDRNLGSVATVYTPEISTTPASLYAYSLTGRLPGLYTEQLQGFRGFEGIGSSNVTQDLAGTVARTGLSTFSDNNEISMKLRGQNPVVIVDGIQRSIFSLDPESIESISVLKDGLST